MSRLKHSVLALGMFLALPVVDGFAADAGTSGRVGVFNGQLQSGGGTGNTTPTKPPVLTQVFFDCSATSKLCRCKNAQDCGRMGQAGVCDGGFAEDGKGGGMCFMKKT